MDITRPGLTLAEAFEDFWGRPGRADRSDADRDLAWRSFVAGAGLAFTRVTQCDWQDKDALAEQIRDAFVALSNKPTH